MKNCKMFLAVFALLASLASPIFGGGQGAQSGGAASQASWKPARDFTIRVPFAAGGSFDNAARIVGQGLQKAYGKSVIIKNMTGANGAEAAADLASYPPEVTEMMGGGISMFTLTPLFNTSFNMKLEDYKIISGMLSEDFILCVNSAKTGMKSWQDLLNFGKANRIICATNAPGGTTHMLATGIFGENNLPFDALTDSGGNRNMLALIAGDSNCTIVTESVAAQNIKAGGDIIPIMVFSDQPYTKYPGYTVPTAKSFGMDIVFQSSNFLMSRAGVPQAQADAVYKTILAYYETDEFKELAQKANFVADTSDGETVRKTIESTAVFCKRIFDKYYKK